MGMDSNVSYIERGRKKSRRMQSDEVIWQVIGKHFCAYKIKAPDSGQHFCRNAYNLTGLCSRLYCPLANSQYATVREQNGICYLYMKTVERSHLPAQLWEKIRLPNNYTQGIEEIEKHLEFWPDFLKMKCKQRLRRLFQYLSKVRRLRLQDKSGQLHVYKQKTERREARRERKAEQVARLDQSIEKELVARLKSGLYQDVYNVSQETFEKVLKDDLNAASEHEEDIEFEEFVEGEEDGFASLEEDEYEGSQEEMEVDFEESDTEIEEATVNSNASRKKPRKEAFVHIEYEEEAPGREKLAH